jgi:chaperone BCS1
MVSVSVPFMHCHLRQPYRHRCGPRTSYAYSVVLTRSGSSHRLTGSRPYLNSPSSNSPPSLSDKHYLSDSHFPHFFIKSDSYKLYNLPNSRSTTPQNRYHKMSHFNTPGLSALLTQILQSVVTGSHPNQKLIKLLAVLSTSLWGIYSSARFLQSIFWPLIFNFLISSITVHNDEPSYETIDMLLKARSIHLMAKTISQLSLGRSHRHTSIFKDENSQEPVHTPIVNDKDSLDLVVAPGYHLIRHNGRWLCVERSPKAGNAKSPQQYFTFFCLGRSSAPIKSFLREAHKLSQQEMPKHTKVWTLASEPWRRSSSNCWTKKVDCRPRPMESIIMEPSLKEALIKDTEGFRKPEEADIYFQQAIPYRRGYLLYGPPGNGKSSFILALASHLKLDIYIIKIQDMSEANLDNAFNRLPPSCVVVLEDIDSAGVKRDNPASKMDQQDPKISLSALLNIFDGIGAHEGHILVLTANNPEALDHALTRPGRVDMKVEFRNFESGDAEKLFTRIYSHRGFGDLETTAKKFSAQIPDGKFSAAQIQGFLLGYRLDPEMACAKIKTWVTETGSPAQEPMTNLKPADETPSLSLWRWVGMAPKLS